MMKSYTYVMLIATAFAFGVLSLIPGVIKVVEKIMEVFDV